MSPFVSYLNQFCISIGEQGQCPRSPLSFTPFFWAQIMELTCEQVNGAERWGFEIADMFITNPLRSECGRFDVDPFLYYGVPQLIAEALVIINNEEN